MLNKLIRIRETGSLVFLIALILGVGIKNPSFLQPTSLLNILNDSVVFVLLSVGIAFVILTGEIDVSIGAVLGLSAAVGGTILRDGGNLFVAIFAAILIGAFIGVFNGIGVTYLGIPSLIFTLGTNGLVRGLVYVYTKGEWVENLPAYFTNAATQRLFFKEGITYFYLFTIIAVCIIFYMTNNIRVGRYFKAIGDNMQGAALVGIPTKEVKVLSYILCGVFAAVAGMLYSSRVGFITPIAGNGYEMKAIAACVIGGIALTGGQGSVLGATIGATIMSSISRSLVFLGFSSDYDNTITGIILIVIVVVTTVTQNKEIIKNKREVLLARTSGGDTVSKIGESNNE